jgi:predicted nucleotidyltransferase
MLRVFYFDREKVGKALDDFVRDLQARPEVLQVIAFGSWIRGESVPGSEWDLYTMYKLCGDWKPILIDFSPELIPACLGQNQCPQT